jgi:SAM-dependent methyltransferase
MLTSKQYESITGKRIRYEMLEKFEMTREIIDRYKTDKLSVLDLACGHGLFTFYLKSDWTYTGVDLDEDRINRCSILNRKFIKADVQTFNEGKYDVILALDIIEHLTNPKDCLSNIYDMLNDDGIFIVSNPNKNGVWGLLWDNEPFDKLIAPLVKFYMKRSTENYEDKYYDSKLNLHKNHWNPSQFSDMASDFELIEAVNRPMFLDGIGFLFKDSRPFLKLDRRLGKVLPTGWFLVFRKRIE